MEIIGNHSQPKSNPKSWSARILEITIQEVENSLQWFPTESSELSAVAVSTVPALLLQGCPWGSCCHEGCSTRAWMAPPRSCLVEMWDEAVTQGSEFLSVASCTAWHCVTPACHKSRLLRVVRLALLLCKLYMQINYCYLHSQKKTWGS